MPGNRHAVADVSFRQDRSASRWRAVLAQRDADARSRVRSSGRIAVLLRQRGSLLKTSAGYEIFIDQTSADVLFALRRGAEQLLLTVLPVPIAAGLLLPTYAAVDASDAS